MNIVIRKVFDLSKGVGSDIDKEGGVSEHVRGEIRGHGVFELGHFSKGRL